MGYLGRPTITIVEFNLAARAILPGGWHKTLVEN
jgi:hypothetical protein